MVRLPTLQRPQGSFLGSERASVKVQIYNRTGNLLALKSFEPEIYFEKDEPDEPKLVGCSVASGLGSGGNFSLSLWLPPGVDPAELIEPDAWVDVSFCRGDVCWHVFRGTVEESRINVAAGGNGAVRYDGAISGLSFQNCWQSTRVWFNQVNENRGDASIYAATVSGLINSTPTRNLQTVLFGLFREVANTGRANWALPDGLPGRSGTLDDVVLYDDTGFSTTQMPRFTPTGQIAYPDGMVWELATQYMDGSHCELFTDILPAGGVNALAADPQMAEGLEPSESRMAVVFRDKPFPLVDPVSQGTLGTAGSWFNLPTWQVHWQELRSYSLGTNAREALNSFAYVGNSAAESIAEQAAFRAVLWRQDDMRRRGMRSMDVGGPYRSYGSKAGGAATAPNDQRLFKGRRARLRDWYCMGTELRSGRVALWRCFPEIKVGGRLRIIGDTPAQTLTGYIENVQHQWQPTGASTSLSLTRCYFGSDQSFLARLTAVSRSYTENPTKMRPN